MSETEFPRLRAVTSADVAVLKAVIDETGLFPSDMLDEMLAAFLNGGEADHIWLTFDEAKPSALLYCASERMTSGTWNVLLMAVHPQGQGKGRGTAMLRQVERILEDRQQRVLLVETSGLSEFARTRAFYRRCGFAEEARIRDFYDDGEDKVVFRKALSRQGT